MFVQTKNKKLLLSKVLVKSFETVGKTKMCRVSVKRMLVFSVLVQFSVNVITLIAFY